MSSTPNADSARTPPIQRNRPEIRPVHGLMSGLIDYAGLFPPAKLAMEKSVAAYAEFLARDEAWMLGRFIVPMARLAEFEKAAESLLPRSGEEDPWPLSVLSEDVDKDLDAIFAFNDRHARKGAGHAVIDAMEIKVPATSASDPSPSAAFIENTLDIMAQGVFPFFELAVQAGEAATDLRGAIAALAGAEAGAKVRTGGVTADAFPAAKNVAAFLVACHAAEVPIKATAGLHHAIRAEYPLTYEPGCAKGTMHGFVNVFVAATLVHALRIDTATAERVLLETDPKAFVLDDYELRWGKFHVDLEMIERTRDNFALSYGSCSFDEPVAELRAMGWLER